MNKPIGKYRCLACEQVWDGSQLFQHSQSTVVRWTCANVFCGGNVLMENPIPYKERDLSGVSDTQLLAEIKRRGL